MLSVIVTMIMTMIYEAYFVIFMLSEVSYKVKNREQDGRLRNPRYWSAVRCHALWGICSRWSSADVFTALSLSRRTPWARGCIDWRAPFCSLNQILAGVKPVSSKTRCKIPVRLCPSDRNGLEKTILVAFLQLRANNLPLLVLLLVSKTSNEINH